MNEDKFCPTCGREIREGAKTTHEIVENISKMLGINIWDLKGKRSHLLDLENAIIKLKKQEKKELKTSPQPIKQNRRIRNDK